MSRLRKRTKQLSYKELDENNLPLQIYDQHDKEHYDISTYFDENKVKEKKPIQHYSYDYDQPDLLSDSDSESISYSELESISSESDTTDNESDSDSDSNEHRSGDMETDSKEEGEETQVNPNIPSIPFCTYNMNGINEGTPRCTFILTNIDKLTKTFHILLLQETKLPEGGHLFLKKRYPKWGIYHSGLRQDSCGVLTMVSPTLLHRYEVQKKVVSQGRALVIYLDPTRQEEGEPPPKPLTLFNFYLPSGKRDSDKADILATTRQSIESRGICMVGGDFNFVTNPSEDTTSNSDYGTPSHKLYNEWIKFSRHYNLTEIYQRSHSFFRLCDDVKLSHSARLDRLLTSHTGAEREAYRPHAFIPCIPFTKFVRKNDNNHTVGSDHLPVGAIFTTEGKKKDKARRVLPWVAQHPLFAKHFSEHWKPQITDNPFDDMSNFKEAVFAASARTEKKVREEGRTLTSHIDKITAAISLFRTCTAHPFSISELNRKLTMYPTMAPLVVVSNGKVKWEKLQNYLEELISENLFEASQLDSSQEDNASFLPINTNRPKKDLFSLAKELKKALPCNRSKLPGLRQRRPGASTKDPAGYTKLTKDPAKMSILAKGFWKNIWSKKGSTKKKIKRAKTYLNEGGHAPVDINIPSIQRIIDIILDTLNTSPGPDGIPFVVYRILASIVAPIFRRLVVFFSKGGLPDPNQDFNTSLLFLLPKKETFIPEDTRPISVANSENRIIGKIMVAAIAPHLTKQDVLWPAQKGSIAGRQGADHIRRLNELFYRSVEEPSKYGDYYIFFMDTKKAFDSIHHEFIIEAMRWVGLPEWVMNVVRAMLHGVKVTPFFGERSGVWIKIHRGVKQGCPLSPWLFAICMQALIFKLNKVKGTEPFAYVDDLAIGAPNFKRFAKCMRIILKFTRVSGLGVNFDKTKGLASGSAVNFESWARTCPWPQFEVVDRYTYLGILFGRWVTASDIYAVAFEKYKQRLRDAIPAIRTMTPSRRTLVPNIFLIPLFSYIAPFHPLPYTGKISITAIRTATQKAIVSFNGTAYGYDHLVALTATFSMTYPLKDIWAYSVVTLAAQYDLTQLEGATTAPRKGVSNRIKESIEASAFDFVNWQLSLEEKAGQPPPCFCAEEFAGGDTAKKRKRMYDTLIKAHLRHRNRDGDIRDKLRARGLPNGPLHVQHTHKVFGSFSRKLPAPVRYHQFAMVCNAVITTRRIRFMVDKQVSDDHESNCDTNMPNSDQSCKACGRGMDHIEHYYDGSCEIAVSARAKFGMIIQYDLSSTQLRTDYKSSSYLFLPPQPDTVQVQTQANELPLANRPVFTKSHTYQAITHAIAIFNWAFWLACIKFFTSERGSAEQVTNKVISIAMSAWNRTRASNWRQPPPTHAHLPPHAAQGTGVGRTGSTSNRTKQQKELARKIAEEQIEAVPANAAMIFTDGSAKDGHAGAAVVVLMPRHRGEEEGKCLLATQAFEEGTNNTAEMWAIGMGLQLIAFDSQCTVNPFSGHIYVFSDSALSVDIISLLAVPRTNQSLCHAVRELANNVNSINHIHMNWIAGHVGIDGNEIADRSAEEARKRAAKGEGLSVEAYQRRIARRNFLPTHRPNNFLSDWRPP